MFLKSYAKINLSLSVNKKLMNGFHDLQSIYCLIDLFDKIWIKKISKKNINNDQVFFEGPYSKNLNHRNNSLLKCLIILRKHKLISNYYSIKVYKKIPVYAGLGGGTSNAATILRYLVKKKIRKKLFTQIIKYIGSDLILFFQNQGFLHNLKKVIKLDKKYNLHFLLVNPKFKCSTKEIFSKVRKYTRKKKLPQGVFKKKSKFVKYLMNSNNDLQSIVEKKYPVIKKLLKDISMFKGCYLSRMTGSGSTCYGFFADKNSSKNALKYLRKKYPKFSFSIAKTI